MQKIQSSELALLHRVYRYRDRERLSVTVMAGFSLADPIVLTSEDDLWEKAAQGLFPGQILDQGMPKPRGEVLAAGRAYTPDGRPVQGLEAAIECGPIKKRIFIFGDRRWTGGIPSKTEPKPFTQMDITWDRAFGGHGFPDNPSGLGFNVVRTPEGEVRPLPNIEPPDSLILSPDDRPIPAGLGPLETPGPDRLKKLGTFDDKWLMNDWPGLPQDFDFSYFNVAPPDQQFEVFFQGGESIRAHHLSPENPGIESTTPNLRARAFVRRRDREGETFKETPLNLDTVWLMPHLDLGVLIWHGITPITDDEAEDVEWLAAFHEPGREEPKPPAYYQDQCRKMLEAKRAGFKPPEQTSTPAEAAPAEAPDAPEPDAAPRTPVSEERASAPAAKEPVVKEEKAPPAPEPPTAAEDPHEGLPPELKALMPPIKPPPQGADPETLLHHHQDQARVLEDRLNDLLRKMGVDPEQPMEHELPPGLAEYQPDVQPMPEGLSLEEQAAFHWGQAAALENELDRRLAALGVDPEAKPEFERMPTIDDSIEALKKLPGTESLLNVMEELKQESHQVEAALKAKREELAELEKAGREQGEASPGPSDEGAGLQSPQADKPLTREEVIEAKIQGRSLADADLTGLDLSGTDLSGMDFSGANLEGADLNQADLTDGNLSNAILTQANLADARLTSADLKKANLTRAKLNGADLKGASLSEADLTQTALSKATLTQADLTSANLTGASLDDARAEGVKAVKANFTAADLTRADFSKARLVSSVFDEAVLDRTNFGQADLSRCWLCEAKGRDTNFEAANLYNIRSSENTSLPGVKTQGADLSKAYFRDSDFSGGDFAGARMNQASFIGCNLNGADLSQSEAKEADYGRSDLTGAGMRRINLMNGSLKKTVLTKADLSGANLYAVDFYKSVQGETHLDGANLDRTLLTLWTDKK